MTKRRCILVHKGLATFTQGDIDLLRETHEVVVLANRFPSGAMSLLGQFELLLRVLWYLPGSAFLFVWFADYHSLLPCAAARLLGKPAYVVIGGFDAAHLPEFNYGGHQSAFRSWCIRTTCRLATRVLPVSEFTRRCLSGFVSAAVMDKAKMIYNGVDFERFYLKEAVRPPSVITICGAESVDRLRLKGGDVFVAAANDNPDLPFVIVGLQGAAERWVRERASENLTILPWVKHGELPALLNEQTVVCQFSRYESFGVALVEGMACGCVPVGCSFTATGELIAGAPGVVVAELTPEVVSAAVREAVGLASPAVARAVRAHVVSRFSRERRREALRELLGLRSEGSGQS